MSTKPTKAELVRQVEELTARLGAQSVVVLPPKGEDKPPNQTTSKVKTTITVSLGIGIPLLSLAMSKIGGTLLFSHTPLAVFAFGLMASVLVVSLPHLRWSIADITKSGRLASWCLAVALDLSLVLCELVHVYAKDADLNTLVVTVMVTVAGASMVLNCWAFIKTPAH